LSRYDLKLARHLGVMGSYQNVDAFTALYERTHLIVFRYIYALYGEPQEDVEDVWLETFLKAWRSRHQFTGNEDAALGWLLQIARNLVMDKHRQHKRYPVSDLQDVEAFAAPSEDAPESQVMAKEQYQVLWGMLETLSDQQQEMLILRYIVGWQVKQIAHHLQIPENTVSVTLRRILTKLSHQQQQE